MAAHSLMNAFGGRNEEEVKQVQAMAANPEQTISGPCGVQFEAFMKCVESNQNDMSNCKWAYDMLTSCNSK